MEMMHRESFSVLSKVEWQVCEMRCVEVESGRGSGVVFTAERIILAATSLPRRFE